MPGLIDTHIHAPQYVYTGTALNLPLLQWLETYTLPTEAKFADVAFAEQAYDKAVVSLMYYSAKMINIFCEGTHELNFAVTLILLQRRVLKNGTTTACYFATLHLQSTLKLCDITGMQATKLNKSDAKL